jgi:hypothetical protein
LLGPARPPLPPGRAPGGETPVGPNGKAHPPPAGDPERKAILDTLRIRYGDMVFVVDYLKVNPGGACFYFAPRSGHATSGLYGDVSL